MGTFRMPSLGADMESGRLVQWLVAPGDEVHRGDIVAVVDTAKSAIEVEVFEDGHVLELLVEPGEQVPVGTPLATLAAIGEAVAEPAPTRLTRVATPPVRHLAHQLGVDVMAVVGTGRGGQVTRDDVLAAAGRPQPPVDAERERAPAPRERSRVRASPRARRLAADRGVDLADITGTGGAGTVTGADIPPAPALAPPPAEPVQTASEAASGPAAAGAADRRAAMRHATAALMARSAREIPHYYVMSTVDVSPMTAWLSRHNANLPVRERVLPIAVLLRAVALAALAVPDLNGHWIDDAFRPGDAVDLGIATATRGGGLVTPCLSSAQELGVDALMARLADLVRRARKGTLRSSEMAPGTITVSSLADGGPDALFGVIYPPQVALVGIGAITERPWAVAGMLAVRPTVTVTLAADHRATDGRTGAAFLKALTEALSQPEEL